MLHSKAFWQIFLRVAMKSIGVVTVFDQRDPYIDFQVAYGKLRMASRRYSLLRLEYALIYRLTDLITLPTKTYSDVYTKEGIPANRVFGIFRGIDDESVQINY